MFENSDNKVIAHTMPLISNLGIDGALQGELMNVFAINILTVEGRSGAISDTKYPTTPTPSMDASTYHPSQVLDSPSSSR